MVSIIIPTYNRALYIERSINSALSQTYNDIEIMVVDDGSTDDTKTIVEKYCRIHKNVKYFLQANQGSNYARNLGIKYAKGDYICFLDSDDEFVCEKIEKQLSFLKETNADIVISRFMRVSNDMSETVYPQKLGLKKLDTKMLGTNFLVTTGTIFGKSDVIKKNLFDVNVSRLQDWDYVLSASQKYSVFYCEDILLRQYDTEDCISKKVRNRKWFNNICYLQDKYKNFDFVVEYLGDFYIKNCIVNNISPTDMAVVMIKKTRSVRYIFYFLVSFLGISYPLYRVYSYLKKYLNDAVNL